MKPDALSTQDIRDLLQQEQLTDEEKASLSHNYEELRFSEIRTQEKDDLVVGIRNRLAMFEMQRAIQSLSADTEAPQQIPELVIQTSDPSNEIIDRYVDGPLKDILMRCIARWLNSKQGEVETSAQSIDMSSDDVLVDEDYEPGDTVRYRIYADLHFISEAGKKPTITAEISYK